MRRKLREAVLRKLDCPPASFTRLVEEAAQTVQFALRLPNHIGEIHVQRLAFVVNGSSRLDRICGCRIGSRLYAGLSAVARAKPRRRGDWVHEGESVAG